MYIIVVGGGKVGSVIASELLELGHEVLVIEQSAEQAAIVGNQLGSCVVCADGCEASVLGEAGAERANMLIAATDGDEDNLVSCQVAKHHYGVGRVIARINDPKNEKIFKHLGITSTVSAVEALANGVLHEVPGSFLTHLTSFQQEGFRLIGVKIPVDAPTIGKSVEEIDLPGGAAVAVIVQHDGTPQVATGEMVLQAEDEVIALARPEDEQGVLEALVNAAA